MTRSPASPFRINVSVAILACLALSAFCAAHGPEIKAVDKLGWMAASHKPLRLLCRISAAGGFRELYIFRGDDPVFYARDVTAYLWQNGKVIYSASPIYGKSGIFVVDPVLEIESAIVNGSKDDYIVLQSYLPPSRRVKYSKGHLDSSSNKGGLDEIKEADVKDSLGSQK